MTHSVDFAQMFFKAADMDENGGEWWEKPLSGIPQAPIETFIFMDFETSGKFNDNGADPERKPWRAGDQNRRLQELMNWRFAMAEFYGPRITEFCFMSVPRALLQRGMRKMADTHALSMAANSVNGADDEDPLQKLDPNNCLKTRIAANVHTRQINPMLTEERWQEMQAVETYLKRMNKDNPFHLTKEELLLKNTFETEWHAGLYQFLESVPKPACLVAYNGVKFDFRILMEELRRCKDFFRKHFIPPGIFMLDAYVAFLDIEMSHHLAIEKAVNWTIRNEIIHSMSGAKGKHRNGDDVCDSTSNMVEALTLTGSPLPTRSVTSERQTEEEIMIIENPAERDKEDVIIIEKSELENRNESCRGAKRNLYSIYEIAIRNEVTTSSTTESVTSTTAVISTVESTNLLRPLMLGAAGESPTKRQCPHPYESRSEPKKTNDENIKVTEAVHPLGILDTSNWTPAIKRRIKSEYFQRSNSGFWTFNSFNYNLKQGNFKLKNVYKQIIRADFDAHRAQDDTEALAQLCMAYGDEFMRYADAQRLSFPSATIRPNNI